MGWSSGTQIFDLICDLVLARHSMQEKIMQAIAALEDLDWDVPEESAYWKHPVVQAAFKKLHPDWFTDA